MAANNSIAVPSGLRNHAGDNSVKNTAIPKLTGTAISKAIKDVAIVATVAGLVGTVVGYVAANAQQVVSYFFGSSRGSADKTAAMATTISRLGTK